MNMYFSSYGWEKTAMLEYATVPPSISAATCAGCDVDPCTRACVFGLGVKRALLRAHENLSL
jgi:hypothetical protein